MTVALRVVVVVALVIERLFVTPLFRILEVRFGPVFFENVSCESPWLYDIIYDSGPPVNRNGVPSQDS